jgi:hypothetical protein
MRRTLTLTIATAALVIFGGCLTSEDYRAEAGENLCGWVYECYLGPVVSPLEETYEFDDEEECVEWFFERGHFAFDGEWVVEGHEEFDECDFDRGAAHEFLDQLESLRCDALDVRSFVELGEDTYGEPYRDCWTHGGGA